MSKEKGSPAILSKEIADALEEVRLEHEPEEIIELILSAGYFAEYLSDAEELLSSEYHRDKAFLNTIMRALVNGYELENTPEENLRVYYEENRSSDYTDGVDEIYKKVGRREGVRRTLDILGITVEGING